MLAFLLRRVGSGAPWPGWLPRGNCVRKHLLFEVLGLDIGKEFPELAQLAFRVLLRLAAGFLVVGSFGDLHPCLLHHLVRAVDGAWHAQSHRDGVRGTRANRSAAVE